MERLKIGFMAVLSLMRPPGPGARLFDDGLHSWETIEKWLGSSCRTDRRVTYL
jgi:hypothetical protein